MPAKKITAPVAVKKTTKIAKPTPAAAKKATPKVTTKPVKAAKPAKPAKALKGGKKSKIASGDDVVLDIEDELEGEPIIVASETAEKVKPLRMKLSKAKERALMKEFGLDDTVLSEEDLAKRRSRLKSLIKLGKTRGYLTHPEIKDHLPDKLVDAPRPGPCLAAQCAVARGNRGVRGSSHF